MRATMRALLADAFPARYLDELRALGLDVAYEPNATAEELESKARDANILVVRSTKVDRRTIEAARGLGLILRAGAGYDTIDVAAASERGIYVANCPGKNAVAVAELTFGLLLAIDRHIAAGTADLRAGRWNKKAYSKADGLKGRTLGVLGLGAIGQAVVERARAFEMRVVAWSRSLTAERAAELGVERAESPLALAAASDIVTVHLPKTKDTKGLCDATFFAAMKPHSIFLNTSRGDLCDEPSLVRAMKEKGLRAGLDVFANEPAGGSAEGWQSEILGLPGLVGSHHIGASTEQAQDAIAAEAVRICAEYVAKGRAPNVVNIETRTPARCELVVRHYDKVGVLAQVLGIIRRYELNVAEMSNTIFQGSKAAVASIRVAALPSDACLAEIAALDDLVISVEAKRIG
jgi:D-3-phosphoglycerate dehydrogenase